jgi:hypothetical protein
VIFYLIISTLLQACGKDSQSSSQSEQSPGFLLELEHLDQRLRQEYNVGLDEKSGIFVSELVCQRSFLDIAKRYLNLVFENREHVAIKFNVEIIDRYNSLLVHIRTSSNQQLTSCEQQLAANEDSQSQLGYTINLKTTDFKQTTLAQQLVDSEGLNAIYDNVIKSLSTNTYPALSTLAELLFAQELYAFNNKKVNSEEINRFKIKLQSLLPKDDINDLAKFKLQYEQNLESELAKKLKYNREYFSSASMINRGLMQCQGGTHTNLLMNILKLGEEYLKYHPVVVLSAGHLMPGFMTGGPGNYTLYGIETTAEGEGLVYFGNTNNLHTINNQLLVLEVRDYLLLNILQKEFSSNTIREQTLKQALLKTAQRYNIQKVEETFMTFYRKTKTPQQLFNRNFIAFGQSNQAPGSKTRAKINQKTADSNLIFVSIADATSSYRQQLMQKAQENYLKSVLEEFVLFTELEVKKQSAEEIINGSLAPEKLPGQLFHCAEKFSGKKDTVNFNSDGSLEICTKEKCIQFFRGGGNNYFNEEFGNYQIYVMPIDGNNIYLYANLKHTSEEYLQYFCQRQILP